MRSNFGFEDRACLSNSPSLSDGRRVKPWNLNSQNLPLRFPKHRSNNEVNGLERPGRMDSYSDRAAQRPSALHYYDNISTASTSARSRYPITNPHVVNVVHRDGDSHMMRSKYVNDQLRHCLCRLAPCSHPERCQFNSSIGLSTCPVTCVLQTRTTNGQMTDVIEDCFFLHALKLINLKIPRKRIFAKKTIGLRELLSWSRDYIGHPLLNTDDKVVKKASSEIFKLLQVYMRDRHQRGIASEQVAAEIAVKGWQNIPVRDEIYLQIIKQTTNNPSVTSLQQGWELMAICLRFFPPTNKLRPLLEAYIRRQIKNNSDGTVTCAEVCLRRLKRVCINGPRRGIRKPSVEEIQTAKRTIFFPSMFGASLVELMEMQHSIPPLHELNLPWIQIALSNAVLQLGGIITEGIFRIPGDVDEVNVLKAKCDQWKLPVHTLTDPHVPASLLKLWYRELADPLIPDFLYGECITTTDATRCVRLMDKLPTINRNVMHYLVQFLQLFALPKNVARTKMDVNNLALVMAPNCFRCRSQDPRAIVENSRREMHFLKMLITSWTVYPKHLPVTVIMRKDESSSGEDDDSFVCSL